MTTDLTFEQVMQLFLESRKQLEENGRQLAEVREQFKQTDERLAKQSKETNKKIREVMGLFTSQWGKMMEALVKPDALRLFKERGITVNYCMPRVEAHVGGRNMEIDLLLENGREVVVLEVKTTLKVDDVKEFLAEELGEFLTFFPRYQGYKIYGGVAALDVDHGADKFAYRNGLFVLLVAGGVVQIKNDEKFIPKMFGEVITV